MPAIESVAKVIRLIKSIDSAGDLFCWHEFIRFTPTRKLNKIEIELLKTIHMVPVALSDNKVFIIRLDKNS